MAEAEQMRCRELAALFIVREHLRDVGTLDILVDEDDAGRFVDGADQGTVVGVIGREQQAVDEVAAQPVQVVDLALRLVERGTQHDAASPGVGRRLDRCGQPRKEGVGDLGQQQADGVGLAATETARLGMGSVAQRRHGNVDPPACLGGQAKRAVQVARNRGRGGVRRLRYIAELRKFRHAVIPFKSQNGFVKRFSKALYPGKKARI